MLIGIDQGTSGTTVCAFDKNLRLRAHAHRRIRTRHPRAGWLEHDPQSIERSVVEAQACGFANQGESVLAWHRRTLDPIGNAIVWNDRRAQTIAESTCGEATIAR